MKEILLTKEGLEKINAELSELKVRRKKVIDRIKTAKEFGDLSENAEYADARDEQSFIEGRIQELEMILKNSKLVDKHAGSNIVELGSIVETQTKDGKQIFEIVSLSESNPTVNKISDQSPIGQALLGKKVGEEAIVKTPAGEQKHKIVKIK